MDSKLASRDSSEDKHSTTEENTSMIGSLEADPGRAFLKLAVIQAVEQCAQRLALLLDMGETLEVEDSKVSDLYQNLDQWLD